MKLLMRRKGGGRSSGRTGSRSGSRSGSSSIAAKKGASSAFSNSAEAQPFSISSGKSAFAYSDGGGKQFKLASNTPFSGRTAGGATRTQVFGTSRYGSGYPYGVSGSYLSGRPFPYVFYPVPIQHGYYGADEYGDISDSQRPGGNLTVAIIQPADNTSSITYRIAGDNSSVTAVYAALVANCTVANSSSAISPFTPAPTTYPLPEQVVQWYRASTFALSIDAYNNSAASRAAMPLSPSDPPLPLFADAPLPAGLNVTFLACLNMTIGASVPLLDASGKHLPAWQIVGLVFTGIGTLAGTVTLFIYIYGCISNSCRRTPRTLYRVFLDGRNSDTQISADVYTPGGKM